MSSFGSLYVGSSGLQSSQNALNTTAHNLTNVNTKGYTRQQVYLAEREQNTVGASSVSMTQAGLGVNFSEARQVRDVFLDNYYRQENGRAAYYETSYSAINEIEMYFGELEGVAFQESITDLYSAMEEWDKIPDDSNNLEYVILKATEFLERATSVYDGIKDYQKNINGKIEEQVNSINEIGKQLVDLNKKIARIEAGNVEKANDLRDTRNKLLDELSSYVNISTEEQLDGGIIVQIEGEMFVTKSGYYEMGTYTDTFTGFETPIWPHLTKDGEKTIAHPVFDYSHGVSSEKNSDIGSLKAMVQARGTKYADYTDLQNLSADEYLEGLDMSSIMNVEAEFDQLVHEIITAVNDVLSPTVEITDDIGNTYRVWDESKQGYGSDFTPPGEELFVRESTPRYTEKMLTVNGERKSFYVYNEENPEDLDTLYTLENLKINEKLIEDETLLPHLTLNGSVNYELTSAMVDAFNVKRIGLNPTDSTPLTLLEYYQNMINIFAIKGETFKSNEVTVTGTVTAIENKRQQVVGVSSDEELSNMIRFQNAYNASSRYINVVNEMIEHIITKL